MNVFKHGSIPVLTPYFTTYADRNIRILFVLILCLADLLDYHIKVFLDVLQRIKWIVAACMRDFAVYYTGLVLGGFPVDAGLGRRFMALVLLQPWMALFLVAFVMLVYYVALRMNETASAGTKQIWLTVSRYSYGGYLAHAYMLRLTYLLDDWLFSGWNVTIRTTLVWIITLVMSITLTYLLSRLKFGVWITGIPYRKAR